MGDEQNVSDIILFGNVNYQYNYFDQSDQYPYQQYDEIQTNNGNLSTVNHQLLYQGQNMQNLDSQSGQNQNQTQNIVQNSQQQDFNEENQYYDQESEDQGQNPQELHIQPFGLPVNQPRQNTRQYIIGGSTSSTRTIISQQQKKSNKMINNSGQFNNGEINQVILESKQDIEMLKQQKKIKKDLNQGHLVKFFSKKSDQTPEQFDLRNDRWVQFQLQNKVQIMKLKEPKPNDSAEERRKINLNNREKVRSFYSVLVYVHQYKYLEKFVKIDQDGKVQPGKGFLSLYQYLQIPINDIFQLDEEELRYFNLN